MSLFPLFLHFLLVAIFSSKQKNLEVTTYSYVSDFSIYF